MGVFESADIVGSVATHQCVVAEGLVCRHGQFLWVEREKLTAIGTEEGGREGN